MALDERLRRELQEAGRPADPTGIYEDLIRRRERRRISRRIQASALVVAVIAGSILGVYALSRVFRSADVIPATGPANGLIVFSNVKIDGLAQDGSLNVVDSWHLYALDPTTGQVNRVGPDAVDEALYPTWSPDGRRIAFVGFVDEKGTPTGNIYVSDADGTNIELIFRPDDNQQVEGLRWSPDGSELGFEIAANVNSSSSLAGRSWTIWTMKPDGTGRRPVTTTGREMHFSWSPDSTSIVFERFEAIRDEGELGQAAADLFILDIESGRETRLTTDGVSRDPAWSPDGTEIAFSHGPRGDQHVAVFEIGGDGVQEFGDARAEAATFFPYGNTIEWAPDGTSIAFTGHGTDDVCFISTIDLQDGSIHTLVSSPASQGCPGQEGMSWAPAVAPEENASPEPPTPSPSVGPTSATGPQGEDIGLGFPVCNVSSIDGHFVTPDQTSTVFVATKKDDTGGCPAPEEAFNVVALDVDHDGLAETSYGPIECTLDCRAFSAPDIDGDGTDELLVVQDGGAVVGLRLYDVVEANGETSIVPVGVADPGDPQGGFEPGKQASFLLGGDAFELYTLSCGDPAMRNGPGIVVTEAESLPHDSPNAEWHAHRITFALVDGSLRLMDVGDFTEPVTDDPNGPSFRSGERLCGSNLGPIAPIP